MPGFARITFVEHPNGPVRNGLYYEKLEIFGRAGLCVTLPMRAPDAAADPERASRLLASAVEEIRAMGVMIVLPPAGVGFLPGGIRVATGRSVFPFFIAKAVEKSAALRAKKTRRCDVVIVDGGERFTRAFIDALYPCVNFLTVVTGGWVYADDADDIFYETGLDIGFTDDIRRAADSADIIITSAPLNPALDYVYKRGAAVFDVSGGGNAPRLAARRADMLVADGVRLGSRVRSLDLAELELWLYTVSGDYRSLCRRYDREEAARVSETLGGLGLSVARLLLDGKVIIE